jgi:hypothetical protein
METNQVRKGRRCARPIIYVAIALGLFVSPVLAQQTQTKYAGAASSVDWSNSGDGVGTEDNQCTTIGAANKTIDLTNFGFNIPTGATINGIKVELKVAREHSGNLTVQLLKAGPLGPTPVGNAKTFAAPTPTGNICNNSSFITQGGCTDLWGTTWTPSEINAANFGVRVNSSTSTGARVLDAVKITICYTPAAVCGNGTVEPGEQCDGGPCCTAACQFASSGTVCRPAAGECDVEETCTGSSAACPADGFKQNGTACNDGNLCTENDQCSNGQCVGTPKNCDDSKSCTTDSCDPTNGQCVNTINQDSCLINGTCYSAGQSNPQNECQACLPAQSQTQFSNKPNGIACTDDNLTCTQDVCSAGQCTHPIESGKCLINGTCYSANQSNPQNECQACLPAQSQTQFSNKPDGTACTDDGKACTRDICSGGQCTHPLQPAGTPCHPGDNCPANEACTGSSEECPKPDADGDGVRDKCDFCPTTPTNVCLNLATVSAALFSISISSGSSSEMLEAAQADNLGLLVTDFALNQVIVYRGKGDGTFQRFRTYTVGDGPISLRIGDVNGDGKTDWIVANYLSSTLTVGFGQGDGTFTRLSHIFLIGGKNPSSLAVADFNRDGRLDAAVANFGSNNVTILLGQDNGQLAEVFNVPISGSGPSAIVTADFDRDGVLDLAVANLLSNDVSLLKGNGRGWFGETQRIPVREGPVALATDDFNRDGRPDLAAASFAGDTVSLLLSQPRALTFARTDVSVGQGPIAVVTGEFVPGTLSLATANFSANNVSVVLVEDVRPLRNSQSVRTLANPTSLTVGDVNADGRLDIVVVGSPFPGVLTLLNAGNGTFTLKR